MPKTEIFFSDTRKGRRAYRFSRMQFRSFPIALATAELMVATGQAVEIPGNPMRPADER